MRSFFFLCLVITAGVVSGKPNNDYIVNKSNGIGYKLMYHAQPWEKAKEVCAKEGAKLAVPKSKEEFSFIQKVVRGMSFHDVVGSDYKLLVWLGISNLEHYNMWKNIDGENIEDTGFSEWAGQNGDAYSDAISEPHCVGMDSHNPGLRAFWCSRYQPFLCQLDA